MKLICQTKVYTTSWRDINEELFKNINSGKCHCRGPIFGQCKLLSRFTDFLNIVVFNKSKLAGKMIGWFSGLSRQNKVKRKIHHKERPLMSVGTFTVSFIEIQSCHLWTHTKGTWIFLAFRKKRRRMQMKCIAYSRNGEKNWEKTPKKITDRFNWAQERVGPTSLGFCRTLIGKKIKSWKKIPEKNLCCLQKKLRKKLKLFSTS